MRFRPSLWDDSEPLYAPGLKKIRDTFKWVPSKKYRDAGYAIKTHHLGGHEGDGQEIYRARRCRELTREMVNWYDGETAGRQEGTWGWLIGRYLADEYSPINEVVPRTREGYKKELAVIEAAIGDVLINETDYSRLMQWKRKMEEKGRSLHFIKKWFTHWGIVNSYGIILEIQRCRELKAVRGEMKVRNPGRRSLFLQRDDCEKIVAKLDESGFQNYALATILQFELMLRGVDVYGQWTPIDGRTGGIQSGGRMWEGGLTWEMISPDLSSLEKLISKTRDSIPEPYVFDLTQLPEIQQRLAAIPEAERIGPVIKASGKMTPPKNGIVTKRFKAALRDCDLPDGLQIRDTRSGGITEAKSHVDPYQLRDAAGHTQVTTTDRYVRGRSEAANNVVRIRQTGRK
ncbi:MAG: hypothetical protein EP341_03805 [Sphingomonadales bacterium]|nr:MAG: hypothetical protein EP341_03805 [Sphingomonadales bacterium]